MNNLYVLLVFGLIAVLRWLVFEGGLKRILGKFETDLNSPAKNLSRDIPTTVRRQVSVPARPVMNAEEERIRKFKEALGLPMDDSAPPLRPAQSERRQISYPVPPIIAQPLRTSSTTVEKARLERKRLENALREKQRAYEKANPPVPAPEEEGDDSVSRYFKMEEFDRPTIGQDKIPEIDTSLSMNTEDFFNPLTEISTEPTSKGNVLTSILGSPFDLRRMILAQEILGRPKALQNL